MDPEATLERLLTALACTDPDAAHEAVDALVEWIDRGGFVPELLKGPSLMARPSETDLDALGEEMNRRTEAVYEQHRQRDEAALDHRRALALALDIDLRQTTNPSRRLALVQAVDHLDAELNHEGQPPEVTARTAARDLRHVAVELIDTRRAELWMLAALCIEGLA